MTHCFLSQAELNAQAQTQHSGSVAIWLYGQSTKKDIYISIFTLNITFTAIFLNVHSAAFMPN